MRKYLFRFLCTALILVFSLFAFAACADNSGSDTGGSDGGGGTTVTPGEDTGGSDSGSGDTGGSDDGGSSGGIDESKEIASIEVATMPTKTEYIKNETLDLSGGVLTIYYTDGTSTQISMTDSSVSTNNVNMVTVGTKNVRLTVGGQTVTFQIRVVDQQYTVTFDLNYEGDTDIQVSVNSGDTVSAQEVTREGYDFVGWYINSDYTQECDFAEAITSDVTYYALWIEEGAEWVYVTFNYNYYGIALSEYSYPIASGSTVAQPSVTPTRTGYEFSQWTSDANGSNAFDFTTAITSATEIYASWTKTAGRTEYIFEAEDTDLTGKVGPSYSGTAQEEGMIVYNADVGASNDRYVDYLLQNGMSLEFYIASDVAVTDAQIVLRITATNNTSISINGDEFQVLVNGRALSYDTIEISSGSTITGFTDYVISISVSLNEGYNFIQLVTSNNKSISGTTFSAHAPAVDCIKITTTAVLIWDENFGLPSDNY